MSRPAKNTPESVADGICRSLYTEGTIKEFDMLASVKATITQALHQVWPTRKVRAGKAKT